MKTWKSLIVFVVAVFAVAMLGALAKPDAWYNTLAKPPFNPPAWVFAPVWTVLYFAIAVAGWRIYSRLGWVRPMNWWVAQLALNGIWSPLFFGLHTIAAALGDIVLLLVAVVITTAQFFRRDRIAGLLMTPYAVWVSFATALTASIWHLNKG